MTAASSLATHFSSDRVRFLVIGRKRQGEQARTVRPRLPSPCRALRARVPRRDDQPLGLPLEQLRLYDMPKPLSLVRSGDVQTELGRGEVAQARGGQAARRGCLQRCLQEGFQRAARTVATCPRLDRLERSRPSLRKHVLDDLVQGAKLCDKPLLFCRQRCKLGLQPKSLGLKCLELESKRGGGELGPLHGTGGSRALGQEVPQRRRRLGLPRLRCGVACGHDKDMKRPRKAKSRPSCKRDGLVLGS